MRSVVCVYSAVWMGFCFCFFLNVTDYNMPLHLFLAAMFLRSPAEVKDNSQTHSDAPCHSSSGSISTAHDYTRWNSN